MKRYCLRNLYKVIQSLCNFETTSRFYTGPELQVIGIKIINHDPLKLQQTSQVEPPLEVISKLCKDGHRLSLIAQWEIFGWREFMFFFCVCMWKNFIWAVSKKIDKIRLHGWLTWKSRDSQKKNISNQRAILCHCALDAGLSVSSKLFVFEFL